MRFAVFGLGEAGSLIAADLAATGAEVHGYDPADVATPYGVTRHETPQSSVRDVDAVISVTAAVDAATAITQARDQIDEGTLYADLSTAPPDAKDDLARIAAERRLPFADVALMATVPGNGLATPALASGPGAETYARLVNRLGANVEVLSDRPGDAAARKLLRSVVTKGLASVLMESLEAAESHGSVDWLWAHLAEMLTEADEDLMKRLIHGTPKHVDRRIVEMESAETFLTSLGVAATMTSATADSLRRLRKRRDTL